MAGGRPRTYQTEDDLQKAIDEYFEYIKGERSQSVGLDGLMSEIWIRQPEPTTITGLVLHLGFCDRQSFYDYEKSGEFSHTIKAARTRIECEYEKKLTTASSAAGPIFALKNFGWKDKSEHGFTDNEGNDVSPVQVFQLPDNNRNQQPENG